MRSSAEDDYGFSQPLAPPAAATSGVYAEPYAPLQQGYTQGYTPQPTHPHYAPAAGWQSGGFPQPGDDPAEQLRGNMGNGLMDTPKEAPRATVGMRARNISSTLLGEGEPDEPPILEELGINFSHIYSKTKAVLWPRRIKLDQQVIDDCDFAGPLLFCLALAMLLLLKGAPSCPADGLLVRAAHPRKGAQPAHARSLHPVGRHSCAPLSAAEILNSPTCPKGKCNFPTSMLSSSSGSSHCGPCSTSCRYVASIYIELHLCWVTASFP